MPFDPIGRGDSMLDLPGTIRKNSFGAGLQNLAAHQDDSQIPRDPRRVARVRRDRAQRHGERGVAQQRASDRRTQAQRGCAAMTSSTAGARPGPRGGLDDVRLGREAVVENGGDDPRVGVEAQDQQRAPARRCGPGRPVRPVPSRAAAGGGPGRPPAGPRDARGRRRTGAARSRQKSVRDEGQAPPSGASGDGRRGPAGRRGTAGRRGPRGSPAKRLARQVRPPQQLEEVPFRCACARV